MAKQKHKKDRHTSGFLVRLPSWYRPTLEALRTKNRRPFTSEVLIALERHCQAEGIPTPQDPKQKGN